jgi:hypothetical protein
MMATLTAVEYHTLCRNVLHTFAHRGLLELNPQARFLPNWHIELVAAKLEACRRGEIKRLIINVPPRSLKSHLAAVSFPAFLLGQQPTSQIICAS